jgi:tetratricopeptide (TPR) repeat protein
VTTLDDGLAELRAELADLRELARESPDGFEADVVLALAALAEELLERERWAEALAAGEEAVIVGRRLVHEQRRGWGRFADLLDLLAAALWRLDRRHEAVAVRLELLDVRAQLAQAYPAEHAAEYADALNVLSQQLSKLGQHERAVPPAQEAVEIFRRLAGGDEPAYGPGLAVLLESYVRRLAKVGRRADAQAAAAEGLAILQRLAPAGRAEYPQSLASLTDLAARLAGTGPVEPGPVEPGVVAPGVVEAGVVEAGVVEPGPAELVRRGEWAQAVEGYRALAAVDPRRGVAELGWALVNLGAGLRGAGRLDEALAASSEAAEILRRLSRIDLAGHGRRFVLALDSLGQVLADLRRPGAAAATVAEAAEVRRALADPEQPPASL